jgi:uncharacterized membrane protein YedE/YeeE
MDLISMIVTWTYKLIAIWYVVAIIGGVLILIVQRFSRSSEPSEVDVHQAAERYREWYGDETMAKIGDHMLAASFAPDGRHRRFLKRVSDYLSKSP